jgi:LysR family transcriptional regulator, nitrogen assimilation regulatory protein
VDVKHIRYFLSVATHKSFSKAAAELAIAQPAISRQIQLLEEELGVKVLFRTTRGVELTPAGEELYLKGGEIVESVDQLSRSLRSRAGQLHGKVSIGIPPSCTELLVPLIISHCQVELPDVELRIIEGITVFLEDMLGAGSIDLAVLSGIPAKPSTLYSSFAEEELVLVGSERLIGRCETDIDREELCGVNLIMTKAFRAGVAGQLSIDVELLRCAMEIDSVPAIKKIVASGFYATILPRSLITSVDQRAGMKIRSIASRPRRNLFIGAHPRLATSSAIRAVRDVIVGSVRTGLVMPNRGGHDRLDRPFDTYRGSLADALAQPLSA